MSDRATSPTPAVAKTLSLWPTYALRGWLAAVLSQTLQGETQIKYRIEDLETEAARLRAQLDRATLVIESLQQSIRKVDDAIRRQRDADIVAGSSRVAGTTVEASATSAAANTPSVADRPNTSTKAETRPRSDGGDKRKK